MPTIETCKNQRSVANAESESTIAPTSPEANEHPRQNNAEDINECTAAPNQPNDDTNNCHNDGPPRKIVPCQPPRPEKSYKRMRDSRGKRGAKIRVIGNRSKGAHKGRAQTEQMSQVPRNGLDISQLRGCPDGMGTNLNRIQQNPFEVREFKATTKLDSRIDFLSQWKLLFLTIAKMMLHVQGCARYGGTK